MRRRLDCHRNGPRPTRFLAGSTMIGTKISTKTHLSPKTQPRHIYDAAKVQHSAGETRTRDEIADHDGVLRWRIHSLLSLGDPNFLASVLAVFVGSIVRTLPSRVIHVYPLPLLYVLYGPRRRGLHHTEYGGILHLRLGRATWAEDDLHCIMWLPKHLLHDPAPHIRRRYR